MSVYVDQARNPFGRMLMCHMIADTLPELHAIAGKIGIARKWLQASPPASFPHYDIAQSKRALAIEAGAVSVTMRELAQHMKRIRRGSSNDGKAETGEKQ
jgi:hypothetical protein